MNDSSLSSHKLNQVLRERYRELLTGMPPGEPTWVTDGGPGGGLYGTLEGVSAEQASRQIGNSTIAAHTEHVRWAMALVNGYFRGTEPSADWSESWSVTEVGEAGWAELRDRLRKEGDALLAGIEGSQTWEDEFAINGALASLAHTAYHLGALRQMRKVVAGGV